MTTKDDIRWSQYKNYEGPFFIGRAKCELPQNPTEDDRIIAVITATEGGHWDSYNGYDTCISTVGPIQICERSQYSVSDLLGVIFASGESRAAMLPVIAVAKNSGLSFHCNEKNRWRFHFDDIRGEVDRDDEQHQMFQLTSNGQKGTWNQTSIAYAKTWAAAICTTLSDPRTFSIVRYWLTSRLRSYAFNYGKILISSAPDTNIGCAFVAAYLSFSINNPTWASENALRGDSSTQHPRWTMPWLIDMLKELTFGRSIPIYPARYQAIRPVLEQLYEIDLPNIAEFKTVTPESTTMSTTDVQEILVTVLGFNLGCSGPNENGVDGHYGKFTKAAVTDLQQLCGQDPTGFITPYDCLVLRGALDAWDLLTTDQKALITSSRRLGLLSSACSSIG